MPEDSSEARARDEAAARWVLRADRGLTPAEQDDFSAWLAADSRHPSAYAEQRRSWEELDRIAGLQASFVLPNPDLVGSRPGPPAGGQPVYRRRVWLTTAGAAAALAVFGIFRRRPSPAAPAVPTALAAPCERRLLEDGSRIDCNRGAYVAVAYTAVARHVRLQRGEANFTVAKDPARPFFVTVGDVTLRAVGTEFNVRMDAHVVEVVVREGRVEVGPSDSPAAAPASRPLLGASQRAVIPHTPAAAPLVSTLTARELEARLAWQPRLLDFTDTPLPEIVEAFNRRNILRVSLDDPRLRSLQLSVTFRSDNVEGFLRLLASDFGVRAEWRSEREVALRKAE
jgi:transmembrane sensor